MSALDQRQTCASAIRHVCFVQLQMSAKGQQRTFAYSLEFVSGQRRLNLPLSRDRKRKYPMLTWVMPLLLLCSILTILAPARPMPSETWTTSGDGTIASVTGRTRQPIWIKMNPVWWFLNDDEPDPPEWQLPGKPYIIRQLSWYLRNPLQNFGKYVLGVADRNYAVVGTAPIFATTWSDVDPDRKGWKVSTIRVAPLRLPFVSYENEYLIWYAGWQWSGFFGFKFNLKKSPMQFW